MCHSKNRTTNREWSKLPRELRENAMQCSLFHNGQSYYHIHVPLPSDSEVKTIWRYKNVCNLTKIKILLSPNSLYRLLDCFSYIFPHPLSFSSFCSFYNNRQLLSGRYALHMLSHDTKDRRDGKTELHYTANRRIPLNFDDTKGTTSTTNRHSQRGRS